MIIGWIRRNTTTAFRTFKAIITRPFSYFRQRILYITNISRHLAKAPRLAAKVPQAVKLKPEKREDFVDLGDIYVAKKFFVLLLAALVCVPLLIYFFIWPFLLSRFFTAHMYYEDPKIVTYTGKVLLYHDSEKQQVMFKGRLIKGMYQQYGVLYDDNGWILYEGSFLDGLYDGNGTLYDEGRLAYKGGFSRGLFEGVGNWYEKGRLIYQGQFEQGFYQGRGTFYENGRLTYEGNFKNGLYDSYGIWHIDANNRYEGMFLNGLMDGKGKQYTEDRLFYEGMFESGEPGGLGRMYYPSGTVQYKGMFHAGALEGSGIENFESGSVKYSGMFKDGRYDGQGSLYDEEGVLIYEGSFTAGEYRTGKLYADEKRYEGGFENNAASGIGKLYIQGSLYYEGEFNNGYMEGAGKLTDKTSGLYFEGNFLEDKIDPTQFFYGDPANLYNSFNRGLKEYMAQDAYWLFNGNYGVAIKIEFATQESAAYVSAVYLIPEQCQYSGGVEGDMAIVNRTLPYIVSGILDIPTVPKYNTYQKNANGFLQTIWIETQSNTPLVAEYKPVEPNIPSAPGGGLADGSAGNSTDMESYFEALGLDINDFNSLDLLIK